MWPLKEKNPLWVLKTSIMVSWDEYHDYLQLLTTWDNYRFDPPSTIFFCGVGVAHNRATHTPMDNWMTLFSLFDHHICLHLLRGCCQRTLCITRMMWIQNTTLLENVRLIFCKLELQCVILHPSNIYLNRQSLTSKTRRQTNLKSGWNPWNFVEELEH